MSSSALENKHLDATDVEGMQRFFQTTWPSGSIDTWYLIGSYQ